MSTALLDSEPIYSSLAADADLQEIIAWFVDELSSRAEAVRERFEQRQWDALRSVAHQLKGAGGSYGFAPLSAAAARLESSLRDAQPEEQVREAVDALVALCARVRS